MPISQAFLSLRAPSGLPKICLLVASCNLIVMIGPSFWSSHLVFEQIALDGDLRLTVPSALLSSPEATAGSSLDSQYLPGTPGFATPLSSPSLSCCVLSVTYDHPSPCTIFLSPFPSLSWYTWHSSPSPNPSMPQGRHGWQSPRNPIQAAANYTKAADRLGLFWSCICPLSGSLDGAALLWGPCVCAQPWSRRAQ